MKIGIISDIHEDVVNLRKAGFNYPDNCYDLDFDERNNLANGKIWLYEDHDISPMLNKKIRHICNFYPSI